LGEFVALGMLFHAKKIPSFLQKQKDHLWQVETVELVSNKTMVIVGFGDIGAACGKLVKAFGTKVIGLKRRPE
jgi:phosphoglycerate dehydrogenase-like enzyme